MPDDKKSGVQEQTPGTVPNAGHQYRDYGGNPLAHVLSETGSVRLPAFGGVFQPGIVNLDITSKKTDYIEDDIRCIADPSRSLPTT